MPIEKPLNSAFLVTLLCPRCKKRVAVMDHFPTGKETPKDITLIDGTTPRTVYRLVCRSCFTTFPPEKAHFPEHVFLAPGEDTPRPKKSRFAI